MKMKIVKKTENYTVLRRNDGRYAVRDFSKTAINGAEKVRILLEEELIVAKLPDENRVAGSDDQSDSDVGESSETDSAEVADTDSASDENTSEIESEDPNSGVEADDSD